MPFTEAIVYKVKIYFKYSPTVGNLKIKKYCNAIQVYRGYIRKKYEMLH